MAVNLTTNWQTIANDTWNFSGQTIFNIYLEAKYSTQDLVNNKTTIQTRLRTQLQTGYGNGNGYNFSCSYANTVSGSGLWYLDTEVITSGETTITHNNDGTKSLTLSGSASISGLGKSSSLSNTVNLPTIPRASKLNSASISIASNGSSITITPNMTKNVSTYYDSLTVKNGNTNLFTIDGVTHNTAKSLTSAQINSIYSAIGTATTKTLTCYLTTYTNSSKTTTIGTSSSVNLVATLPSYSLSFTSSTVEDSVTTYNTYKPNTSTFIANLSKPKYTFSASSNTGSTYGRSIGYAVGSTTVTSPYTNNNYTGQSLTITASDGRKSATSTPSMTHIAYFTPTVNATVTRTTPTGSTIDVSVNGTYYDGDGLTNLNNAFITLKYTESGGTEQTVTIPCTVSTSGHIVSFNATYQLTGMNYQKSVQWSITIFDKLNITKTVSGTVTQGLPVWNGYRIGDTNHFNVNGTADLFLHHRGNAPTDLNNAITHGTYQISGTYTNAPSSSTIYGILIVYESRGKTWAYSDSSSWIWQELHTTGGTVYTREGINSSTMSSWKTIPNSLLSAYPVGSVYMSWNSTSPASLFGGTWTQLKNAFIFGINATTGNGTNGNNTGTSTGNVKLTASQSGLPKHYHDSLRWTTSTGNVFTANGGSVSGKFGLTWGSNNGQSANIVTSEAGGTSASDNHSHTVPYIAVFVWRRTA